MTKKTLQLIATVALAAGFGFTTVTANADETTGTDNQTTTATVGLKAGDGGSGAHAGSIKLVAAPDMVFGPADGTAITGAAQTIMASSLTTNKGSSNVGATGDDKVAVEDSDVAVVNAGSEDPWTVTVKADNFVKTGDDSTTLLGAKINFDGAAATNNDDIAAKPAVAVSPSITAGSDGATILSATAGNGIGTWMNRLTKNTNLSIAGGNSAGTYTSNLTWTIADTASTQA